MANKKISCYFHESSHFDRPHGYTFTLKSFLLEYLNFYSQIEIIRTTLFFGLHYQIYQIISIPNKITGCISNAYLPRQIYQKRKKWCQGRFATWVIVITNNKFVKVVICKSSREFLFLLWMGIQGKGRTRIWYSVIKLIDVFLSINS